MARYKWVWDEKKQELVTEEEYNRSYVKTYSHAIHTDTIIGGLWHPCDGNKYDSKSKFREVTKQHGCIEKGNETSATLKDRKERLPARADVMRAFDKVYGRN